MHSWARSTQPSPTLALPTLVLWQSTLCVSGLISLNQRKGSTWVQSTALHVWSGQTHALIFGHRAGMTREAALRRFVFIEYRDVSTGGTAALKVSNAVAGSPHGRATAASAGVTRLHPPIGDEAAPTHW
jgi:hypothetical protein